MSRRRYPKSHAAIARQRARDTEQLIWSALVLVVLVILYATGWWLAISGWAGDLIAWAGDLLLDQIKNIGNMQPE